MSHVRYERNMRIGDCVTLQDFADEMGVLRTSVASYKARGRMPEPVAYVCEIPLWTRRQMRRYLADRAEQQAQADRMREST